MKQKQLVIIERSLKTHRTPYGHKGRGERREFLADIQYKEKKRKRIIKSCHVHLAGKAERYPDKALGQVARAFFLGTISGKVVNQDKSYELVGVNDVYT